MVSVLTGVWSVCVQVLVGGQCLDRCVVYVCVQVLVGGQCLDRCVLTEPGSHVLTVTSPVVPLSGQLQLQCHTRHSKLLQHTVAVTYVPSC